jgi:hypothetical protein
VAARAFWTVTFAKIYGERIFKSRSLASNPGQRDPVKQ